MQCLKIAQNIAKIYGLNFEIFINTGNSFEIDKITLVYFFKNVIIENIRNGLRRYVTNEKEKRCTTRYQH